MFWRRDGLCRGPGALVLRDRQGLGKLCREAWLPQRVWGARPRWQVDVGAIT